MHAMQINEVFATFFLYLILEKNRKMHNIRNSQIPTFKAHLKKAFWEKLEEVLGLHDWWRKHDNAGKSHFCSVPTSANL
jgi:hypothetical protein